MPAPMNPYIKNGSLIVPHDSDAKYHYWRGGQPIIETLAELDAPPSVFALYIHHKRHIGETCVCDKPAKSTSQVFYCVTCIAWWEKP